MKNQGKLQKIIKIMIRAPGRPVLPVFWKN